MSDTTLKPFSTFVIRIPYCFFKFLQKNLEEKISEAFVQEAIYLASPTLYMATRCTPFGLFANCISGKLGDETLFSLNNSINRTTRLDMYYLCALSQSLSKIQKIKEIMKYYPNTSLYSVGEKYRYIEYQYVKNKRKHFISSVKQSKYLANLLTISEKGAYIHELITYLLKENIEEEIAINFIDELIDSQILEGELSPSVTGNDYFILHTV